ncbi:MAG TPA: carotenoid biosynthesis protein [Anaerolineae bacterium]|nr:carotenoid biosynthesis protein [Anaerolineae bacterium]
MPPLAFLIFEIGVYVLAVLCLWHAWRHARYLAIALVVAIGYSYATEIFAINLIHEYYYNRFLIMICRDMTLPWGVQLSCAAPSSCVPLAIPVMEAMILYAAIQTSNRLALPWAARPVLDGLLAISIDLVMDPIVSASVSCQQSILPRTIEPGVGFWVWLLKPTQTVFGITLPEHLLFGIPLNNFSGWFLSVVIFSFMLRIGWKRIPPESKGILGDLIAPIAAIPLTLLAFTGVIAVYQWLIKNLLGSEWILVALILAASILVVLRFARQANRANPLDLFLLAVPLFFQLYFLVVLFASDLHRRQPALVPFAAVLFPISLLLFSWPYWNRIASAVKPARGQPEARTSRGARE